jgi:hypothetical protein
VDELVQAELAVAVRVYRLERVDGQLGIEAEDLEEELELVALDHSVAVGVDGAEKDGERSGKGLLGGGVVHALFHSLDEQRLRERMAGGDVLEEFVPYPEQFLLEVGSPFRVELLALDEARRHRLEVLLRDRPVFVEVDAREVRLHLARPEIRHPAAGGLAGLLLLATKWKRTTGGRTGGSLGAAAAEK